MPKTLLRQERERRGWSRDYIAEQVEVEIITVGRWERGESLPHPHYRQKICTLFAMTAEELGLLPEMFQKSNETVSAPPDAEQTMEGVDAALELATMENADVVSEAAQPASAPPARAEETPSHQRRKLLLGIGGLGVASLAGIGVFYLRSLSSDSAHISPPDALVLPNQPTQQLFDPADATHWVNRLAWAPDGSRIAVANGVPDVSIWNIAQEAVQFSYPTLNQWVNDVSWSKNNWIAAANAEGNATSGKGSMQTWRFPELTPIWTLQFPYALRSVSWSPDGTMLALSGHAQTVEVWSIFTKAPLNQYTYRELKQLGISRVRWSPDGTMLACATDDGTVHILKAIRGEVLNIYREHTLRTVDLAWSPDGTYIASGGEDHTVRVWHALSGQTLLVYRGHTNDVEAVDWSPQNTYIASGGADSMVLIWEARTGKLRTKYQLTGNTVEALTWSPDGQKIAAGTSGQGTSIW